MPQTQAQWEEGMAQQILAVTRSDLYLALRYLSPALAALPWQARQGLSGFATDGGFLYYPPARVVALYRKNPKFLCRAYLHSLLHCLFRHLWLRAGRDPLLWSLACDIAVEHIIDGLRAPCLQRPQGWTRTRVYQGLQAKLGALSAGPVYHALAGAGLSGEDKKALYYEFYTDDHALWPQEQPQSPPVQYGRRWEQLGRQTQLELDAHREQPGSGSQALETQVQAAKSRRSYRDFLRRFAVLREEPRLDPDGFDPILYSYGLQLYGDLPLVEPLETREAVKVNELVIVLDTSYSTSGALVKGFLTETFALLGSGSGFFDRCHIRILQCDDAVREETVLTDRSQLEAYMARFRLVGGGGTDFRPAFAHVDELLARGALRDLRGLLYFTDGKGRFPQKPPPYQTAFLFLDAAPETVPPWAIRLVLDRTELAPEPPDPAEDFSIPLPDPWAEEPLDEHPM